MIALLDFSCSVGFIHLKLKHNTVIFRRKPESFEWEFNTLVLQSHNYSTSIPKISREETPCYLATTSCCLLSLLCDMQFCGSYFSSQFSCTYKCFSISSDFFRFLPMPSYIFQFPVLIFCKRQMWVNTKLVGSKSLSITQNSLQWRNVFGKFWFPENVGKPL